MLRASRTLMVSLLAVAVTTSAVSYASLFDRLKDRAVNTIKNETERNVGNTVDQKIRELVPSLTETETVNVEPDFDLTPAPGEVSIYTRQGCPYCTKALSFLDSNGIAYTQYDVMQDDLAKQHYKRLNGRGVPIILAGEERLNGYSESSMRNMLAAAGIME